MSDPHDCILGLSIADPSISWPARGTAETSLCDRAGWQRRAIPTTDAGKPAIIMAMCRGELAVNHMLGGDEGFAISLADSGFRLSYGGRVFARCPDAMKVAEAMMEASADWRDCQARGYTSAQRRVMKALVEAAERRGEVMLDRVYPT